MSVNYRDITKLAMKVSHLHFYNMEYNQRVIKTAT